MIDYLKKFFSDTEYKVINFDKLNENYKELEALFKSKLEKTYETMKQKENDIKKLDELKKTYETMKQEENDIKKLDELKKTYKAMKQKENNIEKLDELKKQALYIKSLILYAPFIRIKSINENNNGKVKFKYGLNSLIEEDIKTFLPENTTMIVGHTRIFNMEKNVEQHPIAQLDRAAQGFSYIDIAKTDLKDKNKYGIPNIGIIAKSGNVIVYPLPLSSITERDKIPEYYVSITNNEETFTVSVNVDGKIEVSKINKNIDKKILSRYKEKIPLKDRKNIIKNLLLCYQYDNAKYPEEKENEIKEIKEKIIGVLETELKILLKEENQEEKKEKIKSKESSKPSEEDTREYRKICEKTPGSTLDTSFVNNQKTPKRIKIRTCSRSFNLKLNSDLLENKNQEEKKEEIKLKKSPEPSEKNTTEYQKICGKTPGSTLSTKKQEEKQEKETLKEGFKTHMSRVFSYWKNEKLTLP